MKEADWATFAETLDYVPMTSGAHALKAAVEKAEQKLGTESRLVHYLSVPPSAALSAVRLLAEADLINRSRIIMEEKPFGTDLASAMSLNAKLHEVRSDLPDRPFPGQGTGARDTERQSPRTTGKTSALACLHQLNREYDGDRAPRSKSPRPIALSTARSNTEAVSRRTS